jgi:hypothetical protein
LKREGVKKLNRSAQITSLVVQGTAKISKAKIGGTFFITNGFARAPQRDVARPDLNPDDNI